MKKNFIRTLVAASGLIVMFAVGCSTNRHTGSYGAFGPSEYSRVETPTLDNSAILNVPLMKEQLVVGTREVSNGAVLIKKTVVTEGVQQPVELRREEFVIQRLSPTEAKEWENSAAFSEAFKEGTIYMPLTREEPVTSYQTVLTEKVQLGKQIHSDAQTITRSVRTEELAVSKQAAEKQEAFYRDESRWEDEWYPYSAQGGTSAEPESGKSVSIQSNISSTGHNLNLAREEFLVGKREVQNGSVSLKKSVKSEDVSQPIQLSREEFFIERTPLAEAPSQGSAFQEEEFRINLSRQEPQVTIRSYVDQVVRVQKTVEKDNRIVSGQVRKENLEITSEGAQGGTTADTESGVSYWSGTSSQDAALIQRIRAASQKNFPNTKILANDGDVTLQGKVHSFSDKMSLEKLVREIPGVNSVKSEIKVMTP